MTIKDNADPREQSRPYCVHCKGKGWFDGLEVPCGWCNPGGEFRALFTPTAQSYDNLDRSEVEYLMGLVRMELRKKSRDIEKFAPREGQDEKEAAEVKAGFVDGVARRQKVLDKLTALRASLAATSPAPAESDESWEATLAGYRQGINAMESDVAAPAERSREIFDAGFSADRTRAAGEQSYSEGFDDAARVSRVLNNVVGARRAAEEIAEIVIEDVDLKRLQSAAFKQRIVNVIAKCAATATDPADNDAESRS